LPTVNKGADLQTVNKSLADNRLSAGAGALSCTRWQFVKILPLRSAVAGATGDGSAGQRQIRLQHATPATTHKLKKLGGGAAWLLGALPMFMNPRSAGNQALAALRGRIAGWHKNCFVESIDSSPNLGRFSLGGLFLHFETCSRVRPTGDKLWVVLGV
jgi:hypothetical protein